MYTEGLVHLKNADFLCKFSFNTKFVSVEGTHGCLLLKWLISRCLFHVSQFERLEGIPELGVMAEQTEGEGARDERLGLAETSREVLGVGTAIPLLSPERHQQQVPALAQTDPNTPAPPRDSLGGCPTSLCLKEIKYFPESSEKLRKHPDHQHFKLQPQQIWMWASLVSRACIPRTHRQNIKTKLFYGAFACHYFPH